MKKYRLDKQTVEKVMKLGEEGVSDTQIAKDLNINYSQAQAITTEMWNIKMAKKQLMEIEVIDAKIVTGNEPR